MLSQQESTSTNRKRFEGKVVFISGVARGQGRQHAVRFAQEGAKIIGFDVCQDLPNTWYPLSTPEDLAETVRQVEAAGSAIHTEIGDVRDLERVKEIARNGIDRFGRLDVILANAGTYTPGPVQALNADQWAETIDINLTGVFNTVRAGVKTMIKQNEGGAVVITSSTAGMKGMWGCPAYNAAKHGVVGFMRSLALELAPNQIRVNTLHPSSVATPMIQNDIFPTLVSDKENPGLEEAAEFLTPMQPMGIPWLAPDDISDAVLWLCSDEARYVTGVQLPVDAGSLLK